jgi:hypothetical protein
VNEVEKPDLKALDASCAVDQTKLQALHVIGRVVPARLKARERTARQTDKVVLDSRGISLHQANQSDLHTLQLAGSLGHQPPVQSGHVGVAAIDQAQPQSGDRFPFGKYLNRIEKCNLNRLVLRLNRYHGKKHDREQNRNRENALHFSDSFRLGA